MSAAERYAARKARVAADLRTRTIEAANVAAHHVRLHAKYGPDWRGVLDRSVNLRIKEWMSVVERNPYRRPTDPEIGWRVNR